MLESTQIKQIIEAALLCADQPLSIDQLIAVFDADECDRPSARAALDTIERECEGRGYELKLVASGYRFQIRQSLAPWMGRLWQERPPRYTRALLETLALVAYKQPVTRGDIEQVRGVSVGSNIIRTLIERDWIRVVGFREVPGRPAMYGTSKAFLDYFGLKALDELPPLAEIKALMEPIEAELAEAGPEYAAPLVSFDEADDEVQGADDPQPQADDADVMDAGQRS
ncbi:MAG: SMC-Scp complex subunit ScpB [Gammaproteobacteria bacterium]|nr:SMC-Scp complex subunit ScpB [Gammaproteobacteria bacterium]